MPTALLSGYRPLRGTWDELLDGEGRPRPHWRQCLAEVARLGEAEVAHRFAIAERHLRDSGVFYRVYGDPEGERPWPLSHVPLLISAADWRQIVAGVTQRARLLEAILRDVYGAGRLVAEGALPAAIVAGSPEFLRPLHGVHPAGGRFLHFYAVDLGRGPDGRWWVLGDRAQAPSGAGYALENRIALSRALPDFARALNVHRLAAFFQAFRSGLAASARRDDSRICLLTPGPLNETYFEHAFLARYLGFLMVEGSDLAVHRDTVFVRTVEGLKRADILLRRLDADFADPLELNPASQIGLPGLVRAVRAGSVTIANALGSGFVETRALLGFLPRLAQRLLGEELLLPNVATWWCGQHAERTRVLADLDQLAIAPAFTSAIPGLLGEDPVPSSELPAVRRGDLAAAIRARGIDFVGQEVVRLSTMPVWENRRLVPRPFTLRVYVSASSDGWMVMPGGFCRVSERDDSRALSMQQGGRSADVWVLAEQPVEPVTLLPSPADIQVRRTLGYLPSRAADNLFWLGRYLERSEATLRVVRAITGRLIDADVLATYRSDAADRLGQMLVRWGAASSKAGSPAAIVHDALHRHDLDGAVPVLVDEARRAASVIRDRLSPEAWRALSDLAAPFEHETGSTPSESEDFDRADQALRTIAALAGLFQENTNRLSGWRFLMMGLRIERGISTCRFARLLGGEGAPPDGLDVLLELADSVITYRARYLMGTARRPVLDLVVLDPANPRSVVFQLERIVIHLHALSPAGPQAPVDPTERIALRVDADLRTAEVDQCDAAYLLSVEEALMSLSDQLTLRFFTQRTPSPDVAKLVE